MKLGQRRDESPPEYPVPPEEVYELEFVKYDDPVDSAYIDRRTGDYPKRIRLVFAIRDDDADKKYQGAEVSMWCDLEVNALLNKSIYHPLLALDPENEPEGGEDLDEFKAMRCRGLIKHTVKGDKTYANVEKVMPLKKRRRKADDEEPAGKPRKSAFDVDDEEAA